MKLPKGFPKDKFPELYEDDDSNESILHDLQFGNISPNVHPNQIPLNTVGSLFLYIATDGHGRPLMHVIKRIKDKTYDYSVVELLLWAVESFVRDSLSQKETN